MMFCVCRDIIYIQNLKILPVKHFWIFHIVLNISKNLSIFHFKFLSTPDCSCKVTFQYNKYFFLVNITILDNACAINAI